MMTGCKEGMGGKECARVAPGPFIFKGHLVPATARISSEGVHSAAQKMQGISFTQLCAAVVGLILWLLAVRKVFFLAVHVGCLPQTANCASVKI